MQESPQLSTPNTHPYHLDVVSRLDPGVNRMIVVSATDSDSMPSNTLTQEETTAPVKTTEVDNGAEVLRSPVLQRASIPLPARNEQSVPQSPSIGGPSEFIQDEDADGELDNGSEFNTALKAGCSDDEEMDRVVTEIKANYQGLFPLSHRPWSETIPTEGLESACPVSVANNLPSKGLIAEADYIVSVAQAVKDVREAEEKLAVCRAKESMLRTRLYQVQAAMAIRLKQISLTQVGRARASRAQRISVSPALGVCN